MLKDLTQQKKLSEQMNYKFSVTDLLIKVGRKNRKLLLCFIKILILRAIIEAYAILLLPLPNYHSPFNIKLVEHRPAAFDDSLPSSSLHQF